MKYLFSSFLILLTTTLIAQVGIGTVNPNATIDIVELDGCPGIIKLSPPDHCQMLVLAVFPPGSINGKFERILFLEYNFETINAEDYDSVLGLLKESFRWTLEEPDPAQKCPWTRSCRAAATSSAAADRRCCSSPPRLSAVPGYRASRASR